MVEHSTQVQVRWSDVDPAGVVFYILAAFSRPKPTLRHVILGYTEEKTWASFVLRRAERARGLTLKQAAGGEDQNAGRQNTRGSCGGMSFTSPGSRYGSTRSIFTLRRVRADSIIASVTSTTRSPSRPVAAGWPLEATARWKSSISAT